MSIQTARLRRGADAVREHPIVLGARVVERGPEEAADRVLEVVLRPHVDRVPPGVLRLLADADCGIVTVQKQGAHPFVVAR